MRFFIRKDKGKHYFYWAIAQHSRLGIFDLLQFTFNTVETTSFNGALCSTKAYKLSIWHNTLQFIFSPTPKRIGTENPL